MIKKKWYIKNSLIHGRGVFANIPFKKGDLIDYLSGPLIKIKESEANNIFPHSSQNWIGVGVNRWIDPELPFVSINHSCEPNVGIQGVRSFRALKNISKDEELVFDYAISEVDLLWRMTCSCSSPKCRKEVRSIQYLPIKIINSYLPYIPTAFLRIYEKCKK